MEVDFLSFTTSVLEGGLRPSIFHSKQFYLMIHFNGPDLTLFETFMRLNIFLVYIGYKTVSFFLIKNLHACGYISQRYLPG